MLNKEIQKLINDAMKKRDHSFERSARVDELIKKHIISDITKNKQLFSDYLMAGRTLGEMIAFLQEYGNQEKQFMGELEQLKKVKIDGEMALVTMEEKAKKMGWIEALQMGFKIVEQNRNNAIVEKKIGTVEGRIKKINENIENKKKEINAKFSRISELDETYKENVGVKYEKYKNEIKNVIYEHLEAINNQIEHCNQRYNEIRNKKGNDSTTNQWERFLLYSYLNHTSELKKLLDNFNNQLGKLEEDKIYNAVEKYGTLLESIKQTDSNYDTVKELTIKDIMNNLEEVKKYVDKSENKGRRIVYGRNDLLEEELQEYKKQNKELQENMNQNVKLQEEYKVPINDEKIELSHELIKKKVNELISELEKYPADKKMEDIDNKSLLDKYIPFRDILIRSINAEKLFENTFRDGDPFIVQISGLKEEAERIIKDIDDILSSEQYNSISDNLKDLRLRIKLAKWNDLPEILSDKNLHMIPEKQKWSIDNKIKNYTLKFKKIDAIVSLQNLKIKVVNLYNKCMTNINFFDNARGKNLLSDICELSDVMALLYSQEKARLESIEKNIEDERKRIYDSLDIQRNDDMDDDKKIKEEENKINRIPSIVEDFKRRYEAAEAHIKDLAVFVDETKKIMLNTKNYGPEKMDFYRKLELKTRLVDTLLTICDYNINNPKLYDEVIGSITEARKNLDAIKEEFKPSNEGTLRNNYEDICDKLSIEMVGYSKEIYKYYIQRRLTDDYTSVSLKPVEELPKQHIDRGFANISRGRVIKRDNDAVSETIKSHIDQAKEKIAYCTACRSKINEAAFGENMQQMSQQLYQNLYANYGKVVSDLQSIVSELDEIKISRDMDKLANIIERLGKASSEISNLDEDRNKYINLNVSSKSAQKPKAVPVSNLVDISNSTQSSSNESYENKSEIDTYNSKQDNPAKEQDKKMSNTLSA